MRAIEFLTEAARIEHPEDYLLDGSKRAAKAAVDGMITLANQLAKAPKNDKQHISDATIKWDGKPAVIFGRNRKGEFILTDKSGFSAKGYEGKAKSVEDIETMLMTRAKGDIEAYNARYASLTEIYKEIWPYLEEIAPKRGFLKGDLLYSNKRDNFVQTNEYIKFRPNQITYTVTSDKPDYARIAASKIGIAIHGFIPVDGTDEDTIPFDPDTLNLPTDSSVFVPSNKIQHAQSVDVTMLTNIMSSLQNAKKAVASANVTNLAAKGPGLADLHAMLRTYANKQVDAGNLNLNTDQFLEYARAAKLSSNKLENLSNFVTTHRAEFDSAFSAYAAVIDAKHKLLNVLNEPSMKRVEASIVGIDDNLIKSHEGVVVALDVGGYKLVDRLGFTRSLRARYGTPQGALV